MSRIRFENVRKRYDAVVALDGVDLEVGEGEFLSLLGPSGCGKTTALRLVAGFLRPSSGRILIDGKDMSALPPHRRNAGMVFQDYALFPHMTVADNIAFGLHERGHERSAISRRVGELLELVKLPDIARRRPDELSGGQQQRVALARALAFRPSVLLMDEPLGALDLKLREAMQQELIQIQRRLGITTLFVTHDQGEAMAMSHRIAVMNAGRVEQLGTPEEIYQAPANRFVAAFVGKINLVAAVVVAVDARATVVEAAGKSLLAARPGRAGVGAAVDWAIRPEHLALRPCETSGQLGETLEGTVTERQFAGNLVYAAVKTALAAPLLIETQANDSLARTGSRVSVAWSTDAAFLLER